MLRSLFALLALALVASADDAERDRRARAALALAGAKPRAAQGVACAPMPHPAPVTYPEGYRAATDEQVPLVVFVRCETVPVEGAVVARAETLGDVTGPAVVVGYPVGSKVLIEATLAGTPDPTKVKEAVRKAHGKIDAPATKDVPAPRPLKWDL